MSRTAWSRARLCTALVVISVGVSASLGLPTVSAFAHPAPGLAGPGAATVRLAAESPVQAEQAGPGWSRSVALMKCDVDGGKDGNYC